jgi:hypothetical protein
MLGVTHHRFEVAPVSESYEGRQIVGIDLHRQRSVLVRMTEAGQRLETVRISNDPEYLREVMTRAARRRRWCWRWCWRRATAGCDVRVHE